MLPFAGEGILIATQVLSIRAKVSDGDMQEVAAQGEYVNNRMILGFKMVDKNNVWGSKEVDGVSHIANILTAIIKSRQLSIVITTTLHATQIWMDDDFKKEWKKGIVLCN